MKSLSSPLGTVLIGPADELFAHAAGLIRHLPSGGSVAFSGGSTPKAFYAWAVENKTLAAADLNRLRCTVSDERTVPLAHPDSNFGELTRRLLDPLGVATSARLAWPVALPAPEAAASYAAATAGSGLVYDLCFAGLGDDGHTLSVFPGSPLLETRPTSEAISAVEVPGKGLRLTLTPSGVGRCGQVVVMVTGAGKASMLQRVLFGHDAPAVLPSRLFREHAGRVTWLVDSAAAAELPQS